MTAKGQKLEEGEEGIFRTNETFFGNIVFNASGHQNRQQGSNRIIIEEKGGDDFTIDKGIEVF